MAVAHTVRLVTELGHLAETMCGKLDELAGILRQIVHTKCKAAGTSGPRDLFNILYQDLRTKADSGVDSVIITRGAFGAPTAGRSRSVTVKLGEYGETRLTLAEANLLEVLCVDAPSDDGLVGYKDINELRRLLCERCGRNLQAASLRNLICRLRTTLETRKQNWYLVQTSAGPKYRFALRRGGLFRVT